MLRNELLILIAYLLDKDFVFELDCQYLSGLSYDIKRHKGLKNGDNSWQSLSEILLILSVQDESHEILYGTTSYNDKFFSLHKEDLQCKRIMIQGVSLLIKQRGKTPFLKLVKSSPYFKVLIYFIQLYDGEMVSTQSRYSVQQSKDLQLDCLQALSRIVEHFQEELIEEVYIELLIMRVRQSKEIEIHFLILQIISKLGQNPSSISKLIKGGLMDFLVEKISSTNLSDDNEQIKI